MKDTEKLDIVYHGGIGLGPALSELARNSSDMQEAVLIFRDKDGEHGVVRMGEDVGYAAAVLLMEVGKKLMVERFMENPSEGDPEPGGEPPA